MLHQGLNVYFFLLLFIHCCLHSYFYSTNLFHVPEYGGYPGTYVGGTGAGQVPPRLPLVPGLPGPTPSIAASNVIIFFFFFCFLGEYLDV